MSDSKLVKKISEWVDAHADEYLRDVTRLVAVRSVKGDAQGDAPFGAGPRSALDEALAICGEYGFATRVYGGAVGTADLAPDKPKTLDILGHLDVVGEGEGWETDPYAATLRDDGCLYGRGTDDDKGPVLAALTAMRCVRDLGVPLAGNTRLIMGTDEESGSGDLPYYYKDNAPAPMTFTPDSGFPVYNIEKGGYAPEFTASWDTERALPRVTILEGGFRRNVIPSDAGAIVAGLNAPAIHALAQPMAESLGVALAVEDVPGGAQISVRGTQGHAAYPEAANNGLTALLAILSALPLASCGSTRALRALSAMLPHGDWLGKALGVAQSDELSGPLTVSFTLLSVGGNGLHGQLDCRAPLCANDANTRRVVERAFRSAGYEISGEMAAPHHTAGDGEFVGTLLRCYETYTGKKGECVYTGGGTYVHDIPGGVAFGAGMPDFETNLHGANERMNVADMLTAIKIFALSIAEFCGAE